MKAILLAAGFGTRLGKLGKHTPKCLVDIHGRPLLDLWLDKLSEAGVSEFLINTHHLSFKVEEFISNHPLRDKILIKYEKELLGTAGTLRENKDFIDQDTFVLHADNYFEGDLNLFVQAHKSRPKECSMSMLTFIAKNPKNREKLENGTLEPYQDPKTYEQPWEKAKEWFLEGKRGHLAGVDLTEKE